MRKLETSASARIIDFQNHDCCFCTKQKVEFTSYEWKEAKGRGLFDLSRHFGSEIDFFWKRSSTSIFLKWAYAKWPQRRVLSILVLFEKEVYDVHDFRYKWYRVQGAQKQPQFRNWPQYDHMQPCDLKIFNVHFLLKIGC